MKKTVIEQLMPTFPFIGGASVLLMGAHFNQLDIQIVGFAMSAVGFYYMITHLRSQNS